ncbi:MAG: WS/DGAT domain-containing protein [Acidimicrobiales bacterium]
MVGAARCPATPTSADARRRRAAVGRSSSPRRATRWPRPAERCDRDRPGSGGATPGPAHQPQPADRVGSTPVVRPARPRGGPLGGTGTAPRSTTCCSPWTAAGLRSLLGSGASRWRTCAAGGGAGVDARRGRRRAVGQPRRLDACAGALGSCTPGARVEAMASATRRAKRSSFVPPSGVVARSGVAQRLSWRRFDRQRMANAYVADLPGPPMPLHLAGCRLREAFLQVPLVGNVTLGVGALSHAGCLGVAGV